ncbi:uncharacterized protein LOC100902421 [Galendromus occidentalis]|uniref:Uncharacterized protein LOC100902421 n=1 Tax=Galendromus occidentalis TaxID=34638 RepID=A0AAJ7L762_9ACAR|nr:uncharacterized protein LOC100902421 [Galendromus occidentalis]
MNAALRKVIPPTARLTRSISDRIANHKVPTYDELPKPSGSWQEGYAKQAAYGNKVLAIGTSFFVATVGYVVSTNVFTDLLGPKIGN